jgi:hypothetical protein
MTSVSDTSSGIASAINNVISRLGGLFVIAVLGFFGTDNVFKFGILLCGILAILSGVISFFYIQNHKLIKDAKKEYANIAD